MKKTSFIIFLACLSALFFSCKKEGFINSANARLRITADTLKYDTVFTSVGSVTQSFKIVNENDQALRLSNIELKGGAASAFAMNVNGISSTKLANTEIAARDSIYVFAKVTIDPNQANLPFVVSDSIAIEYNGNQRWVQLQAYGQNARFLNNAVISSNSSFDDGLPYVILGALTVLPGVTLSMNAGTRMYAHADAPLLVYGSLQCNGSVARPVVFSGDRLDEPYKNFPASWPGIYLRPGSKDNVLQFTQIRNAYQALVVTGPSGTATPKLVMQQCIIDNAYDAGLLAANSSISAQNLLISNCGSNIFLQQGGNYEFLHCTSAAYSTNYLLHKNPVLSLANYDPAAPGTVADLVANFTNCIFWGDNGFVENEIAVGKQGNTIFNVSFKQCLYKAAQEPAGVTFLASLRNADPLFDSIDVTKRIFDFHFNNSNLSPALNKGAASGVSIDLDNHTRPVGLPDMGCFEKQ